MSRCDGKNRQCVSRDKVVEKQSAVETSTASPFLCREV